ncbi:MAG: MarR family transcriptional regulator [Clostridia bacterium]|nr:MarR family transcriptional regulator [Clostridia bacterium]
MEEPYRIGWHIKVISNLIKREVGIYGCDKNPDELTGNNMFIIGYLAKNGEKDIFQKDLEEVFSVRRSTMSAMILRMEKKGFLTRESVCHDARLKKLVLTEKGKQIHEMIESRITETEEKLSAGLSEEEKKMLFLLLEKLRHNLETDS